MSDKRYNITAIIYDRRGRVLSVGKNSYVKTHPVQAEHARKVGEHHKIFLHAEIDAIIKCQDLDKAHRIFISRFKEDGTPANAKPCRVCASALGKTKIRHIEYTY